MQRPRSSPPFTRAPLRYHRAPGDRDVQTPAIDALAHGGIELDRFYGHKICSPSRCAIQSGRHPIHVNVQNVVPEVHNSADPIGGFQGMSPSMTGLAEHLKAAGYDTSFVGKYDVGMATPGHHPRARGYDTWLGYWHHSNDYWSHVEEGCKADLQPMFDLWRYNATFDGPAFDLANGQNCSQKMQAPPGETCIHEERILTDEVKRILRAHNTSRPLFLFWAPHYIHMPLQVPDGYLDNFSFIEDNFRRLNHAMIRNLDDNIAEVVNVLHETGMWDTTLLVFHADNGGEIIGAGSCGGNNWPLRGGKFSNWEGGIRLNALVSGGSVPATMRGKKLEGYITAWDWLATYADMVGVDPTDHKAAAAGLPPIDSISVYGYLMGENTTSPRERVVIGDTSAVEANADGNTLVGGLIQGDYKLVLGASNRHFAVEQDTLTGPKWPNASSILIPELHKRTCGRTPDTGCLFNIKVDPAETRSIAMDPNRTAVFNSMLATIDELQKGVYSPVRGKRDGAACKVANSRYDGYWGPFLDL